jgi:hypothetical protein
VFVSQSRPLVDGGRAVVYDTVSSFHGELRRLCLSGSPMFCTAGTRWLAALSDFWHHHDDDDLTREKEEVFMAKRLVVIGGGAGGPSAAAKAKREAADLEVTILEAGEHVSFAA